MGELGLNKILGSIIAAALVVMGLQTVSAAVFSSGGHHGHHGEKKPYNEAIKDKYAYWTEVNIASGGEADEGPKYDLGVLLASADTTKGARVFGSVCASCHTINQGGPNGTGPNLYSLVSRDIAGDASFGYSSSLSKVEGGWTYGQLDAWLIDPQAFARGSNMVAQVKKDPDRANLIAYLAENTPGAPAFPAPLPEEGELPADGAAEPVSEDSETAETGPVEAEIETAPAESPVAAEEADAVLDEMEEIVDRMEDGVEDLNDAMNEPEESVTDAVDVPSTDLIDEVVEAVEDGVEAAEMPAEPELVVEEPSQEVERP